jgi:hypothetical protein
MPPHLSACGVSLKGFALGGPHLPRKLQAFSSACYAFRPALDAYDEELNA